MKIFLVTSTRADFGLLKNLIFKFKQNSYFDLKIIATGTHFSQKYGFSFSEIKNQFLCTFEFFILISIIHPPEFVVSAPAAAAAASKSSKVTKN